MSTAPPVHPSFRLRLSAGLAAAALLLTACGGADEPASTEAATASSGAGASSPGATSDGATSDRSGNAPAAGVPQTATGPATVALGRAAPTDAVIRTGELTVAVDDVPVAAERAAQLARDAGGAVASEDRGTERLYATSALRLRVPPAAFDATVSSLSGLGEERTRRLGSEDVTDQVVDLDSRLTTQRAGVERVRALLTQAEDLGEVVQVEAELTRRTTELEALQARLNALTERVGLATINVRFIAVAAPEAAAGPPGFTEGLRGGWEVLSLVARLAGATAGALLPFSPLLLMGALVAWRLRSRRRAPGAPAPA